MTHIPCQPDKHLHNPDGSHRATPPTARGFKLEIWERQSARHQKKHREQTNA